MYYPYVQQRVQPANRVMTVIGMASVTMPPDAVKVQLEVRTENRDIAVAQQKNAAAMNQLIEALLAFGIEKEHIQTTSYNIIPQYDYLDGEQRFRGYEVANAIIVTSMMIDRIGKIIDLAVRSDANIVSNVQFFVSDEQPAYKKALSEALEDASRKAIVIAETMQLQVEPIPIKIIEERKEAPVIPQLFVAKEMSGTTPIEPGQVTVRASVTVQFQY